MIAVQKFDSICQVEEEFIPDIESLLINEVPNFQYLIDLESSASDKVFYNSFVFFGPHGNIPIGFAVLKISKEKENNFLQKLLKKSSSPFSTTMTWEIPSASKTGVVYDPNYQHDMSEAILDLCQEYNKRDYVDDLYFKGPIEMVNSLKPIGTIQIKNKALGFRKNYSSYQEYLNSLAPDIKKLIKRSWQVLKENFEYENEEYLELDSEMISQCSKAIKKRVKVFQQNPLLQRFIVLRDGIFPGLIIPVLKKDSTYFYDLIALDQSLPESIGHQLAILQTCTLKDTELYYLGSETSHRHLINIGHQSIEQMVMTC